MRIMNGLSKLGRVGLLLALILVSGCRSAQVSDTPAAPTATPQESTELPSIDGGIRPTPLSDGRTHVYLPSINEDLEPAPLSEPQAHIYLPAISRDSEPAPLVIPPTPVTIPTLQEPNTFRFVAWGDTKSGTDVLAALSNQARQLNPAFTLYLGDLEEDGFTSDGITAWADAINGRNGNGIGPITFPVRGNHDHLDLPGWQAYFDTAGSAARIGASNYAQLEEDISYAFEYKNAVFIALDVLGNGDLPSESELAFLDSALTAAEQRGLDHAFITMHGPIYNVSKHNDCAGRTCVTAGPIASFVRVLNNHPIVSAVFNGHEHLFSYVHMDATRIPEIVRPWEQFIAGAAGAGLYPCDQDFRFDYCGGFDGFTTVDVSGKTYTVSIYQLGNSVPEKTYTFTKD